MKKVRIILPLFSMAVLFASCIKNDDIRTRNDEVRELSAYLVENEIMAQPSWTGLYYIEDSAGTGDRPIFGDTVVFHYKGSLLDGTEISNSAKVGEPYSVFLWDWTIIPGLNEALSYMKEGGKGVAIIPSTLAYGDQLYGQIPPFSTLVFELEIQRIGKGIPVTPYDITGISRKTTPSGLQYYIVEETEGNKPLPAQTVKVHYTGYLPDGTIFDSSVKADNPVSWLVGENRLIKGMDEGLMLMRKG